MFNEFNSIENSYNTKIIKDIKNYGYDKEEWIVMEKIHGANFSAITSGDAVCWAKRTSILTKDEKFYNHQRATDDLIEPIKDLFHLIKKDYKNLDNIQVFGELFGGIYNHIDIPKVQGCAQVQSGIHYHPDIKFMIFDIRYKLKSEKPSKIKSLEEELDNLHIQKQSDIIHDLNYLDHDILIKYVSKIPGLLYCKILKRGSFDELLSLKPYFQTTIPNIFGLPEIENNFAEGYVLKPTKNKFFKTNHRVILKLKRDNLNEKIINSTTTKVEFNKNLIFGYLNESRLESVLSKLNDNERQCEKLVVEKLVDDAWIDIGKDYDINEFNIPEFSKAMRGYVKKFFKKN